MKGKLYVWNADGIAALQARGEHRLLGQAAARRSSTCGSGQRYRTQHGFLGSPVVADLDGNGGQPGDRRREHGPPRLRVGLATAIRWPASRCWSIDRSKISAIDPQTHAPTFNAGAGAELDQGAIIDTPAVGDIDGDGKPEIVVGTNEEYKAADDGGFNAGNLNTASLSRARPDRVS